MTMVSDIPGGQRAVLCAVDLGEATTRVLCHAAGFAAALGARLKAMHVAKGGTTPEAEQELMRAVYRAIPYETALGNHEVFVRTGPVVDAILREAGAPGVELIVMGTRALGQLAKLLLGSTSEGVLRRTEIPVLLVPPTDVDIVMLSSRPSVSCGPVLAAIDLGETNEHQLQTASALARLAGQRLLFLTVTQNGQSNRRAGRLLRGRAHHLKPVAPEAFIVRRGEVAQEISRCAVAERAGLVVMGVKDRGRGTPGVIAANVLRTGRAFVLAVPGLTQLTRVAR